MKLSIVVPCFNEAENIPLLLDRFNETIGKKNIEVILVNNGSTDGSATVINKLIPKFCFVRTVMVSVNQGYGYGILQGLKAADGDYIGWTHADMQTDPADIVRAYQIIKKRKGEKIFVKGRRKGRPLCDVLFTRGMSVLESIYFKVPLLDINAQPNIFPRAFFESWENPPFDFALDLYALYFAKKENLKVVRFTVVFPERIYGKSKWNNEGIKSKWKFIKRTLKSSYVLKQRLKQKGQGLII